MSELLPKNLLDKIDRLVKDKGIARDVRDRLLNEVANEAWAVLFPEDVQQTTSRLDNAIRKQRWEEVLTQLSSYRDKDKILRVLESPATGERFYWLSSGKN